MRVLKHVKWYCQIILMLSCLAVSSLSFSWNSQGHLIIAQIAYDKLTPRTKKSVNEFFEALIKKGEQTDFIRSSTWADELRYKNINAYNQWHYIHLPINFTHSIKPEAPNIKTACKAQVARLLSPHYSLVEKAWSLKMLIHLIGDLHQPLHVATLYNDKFPYGDLNGLKFRVKSKYKNLHRFWDSGGGILAYKKSKVRHRITLVKQLLRHNNLPINSIRLEPDKLIDAWLEDSFIKAKNHAYQQKYNKKLAFQYQKKVKQISKLQLYKAGQNLAVLLNYIYDK